MCAAGASQLAGGRDVKHVRYGTTRVKHKSLTFSEFCGVMHIVALRRAGYTDNSVLGIASDEETAALEVMLQDNLLPLGEAIGDELIKRGKVGFQVRC